MLEEWKSTILKTAANIVSWITVPTSIMVIPTNPENVIAWILLVVGIATQFAKYKLLGNEK